MITEKAKRKVALFLKEFITAANVGVGGNSSNHNSNDLDVPILTTKVTTTNTESTANVIDYTATFTGSQLDGNTVREFGIFGQFRQMGLLMKCMVELLILQLLMQIMFQKKLCLLE